MELRGVTSDKQILLSTLERTYLTATSQQNFYQRLQDQRLNLYSRGGKVVGIKMRRKFRFRTLGYTSEILLMLEKEQSKDNRLLRLEQIRKKQQDKSRER